MVKQEDLPIELGRDIAIVELCGPGTTSKTGEEIDALLGADCGGYAEYVVVKPGEFAPKPKDISFIEAAATANGAQKVAVTTGYISPAMPVQIRRAKIAILGLEGD